MQLALRGDTFSVT